MPYRAWEQDEEFLKIYEKIKEATYIDITRCHILYQLALNMKTLPGAVAEVGVCKGGSLRLIAEALPKKVVYGFDTFEGLPPADLAKDGPKVEEAKGGKFKVEYERVKAYLSGYSNVLLYKGMFPESGKLVKDQRFCFVHLDVDLYKSYTDCLEFFYSKMLTGGFIVCDDYGFIGSCPGAKPAVDKFFADKVEHPIVSMVGQALIIKK